MGTAHAILEGDEISMAMDIADGIVLLEHYDGKVDVVLLAMHDATTVVRDLSEGGSRDLISFYCRRGSLVLAWKKSIHTRRNPSIIKQVIAVTANRRKNVSP